MLWEDKRTEKTIEWSRNLFYLFAKKDRIRFSKLLIPYIGSLNAYCRFEVFEKDETEETEKPEISRKFIKVDVKSACWLSLMQSERLISRENWDDWLSTLELRMTEKLFDLSIDFVRFNTLFLVKHPFAKARSWFSDVRLHKILIKSCLFGNLETLKYLIENFTNFDFSRNGNEALTILLKREISDNLQMDLFKTLFPKLKFQNQNEKSKISKLAMDEKLFQFVPFILSIPIINANQK